MSAVLKKVSPLPKLNETTLPVEKLKEEHSQIDAELEEMKSQAPRQQDESTRVFNLRQAQLVQKIRALEIRKVKTERDLNTMFSQKNTTLHDDLKKVTEILVNEVKKLAHFENEIESGTDRISQLKNEMQAITESSIDERKKSQEALASQAKDIQILTDLVKICTSSITQEYKNITNEIEPLLKQKIEITLHTNQLKDDYAKALDNIKTLNSRQEELEKSCFEKSETLRILEEKSKQYTGLESKTNELTEAIIDLQTKKNQLQQSVERAEANLVELNQSGRRLEASISFLHEQYDRKKEMSLSVEKELTEAHQRLDLLKNEEINLIQSCSNYQSSITQIQGEMTSFEALRNAARKLHEEAQIVFSERQQHYNQECRLLEDNFKLRSAQLITDLEAKKTAWELGFASYTQEKEKALVSELEAIQKKHTEDIESRRRDLFRKTQEILKKRLDLESFSTPDQKLQDLSPELEALFTEFFNSKPIKRWWKFW